MILGVYVSILFPNNIYPVILASIYVPCRNQLLHGSCKIVIFKILPFCLQFLASILLWGRTFLFLPHFLSLILFFLLFFFFVVVSINTPGISHEVGQCDYLLYFETHCCSHICIKCYCSRRTVALYRLVIFIFVLKLRSLIEIWLF